MSYSLLLVFDKKNVTQTCIEDLSNEIFYEIFEYLEYFDLFNGFSNLNNRFQNLLNCSSLPLRINLNFISKSLVQHHYTQVIIPNKNRIISLSICDRSRTNILSTLYTIDSSFNRLQLLVLDHVRTKELIPFLPSLTLLPRLLSIIIHLDDNLINPTEVYRLIFLLPFLKKIELSANGFSFNITLPININEQYSPVKRLIINHSCKLKELIALLSYTSQLSHLICKELSKCNEHISKEIPIKMFYLTYISCDICYIQFDEFEIFIKKICSKLRVLCINKSQDIAYLNANRWERLILQYMPYLYKFEFEYHECHYQNIELTSYHNLINQFTSTFWIDRGWFFQIITDIDYWPPIEITYSILSYKKRWYEMYDEQPVNIKLIVNRLYFSTSRQRLVDDIFSFICNLQITHLDMDCTKFFFNKFIKLLSILSNLNSLRISSLSSLKLKNLTVEDIEFVQVLSRNNQIKKLHLECISEEIELEKIQFFIDLCSQMEYFQMKCIEKFNIESIIRDILMKNIEKISHLNLFCLWVPIANQGMIKQLQTIINLEKFIYDYQIKRINDKIYLQWKRQ